MLSSAWKAMVAWYQGRYEPYPPDVGVIGITHKLHWTARVVRAMVAFWLRHWKWIIGTGGALIIGYLSLR